MVVLDLTYEYGPLSTPSSATDWRALPGPARVELTVQTWIPAEYVKPGMYVAILGGGQFHEVEMVKLARKGHVDISGFASTWSPPGTVSCSHPFGDLVEVRAPWETMTRRPHAIPLLTG